MRAGPDGHRGSCTYLGRPLRDVDGGTDARRRGGDVEWIARLRLQCGDPPRQLLVARHQRQGSPEILDRLGNLAATPVDVGETAKRREVVRGRAEHRPKLCCRILDFSLSEERL